MNKIKVLSAVFRGPLIKMSVQFIFALGIINLGVVATILPPLGLRLVEVSD